MAAAPWVRYVKGTSDAEFSRQPDIDTLDIGYYTQNGLKSSVLPGIGRHMEDGSNDRDQGGRSTDEPSAL